MPKITKESIEISNFIEKATDVSPVYCYAGDEKIVVVVEKEDFPKIIGKKGFVIRGLSGFFNKKMYALKAGKDIEEFIKVNLENIIKDIKKNDKTIFLTLDSSSTSNTSRIQEKIKNIRLLLDVYYGGYSLKVNYG